MRKIVVIGANAAGMSFAVKYKKLNSNDEVTVLEKGTEVSIGSCGLPYYVGNRFDNQDQMRVRSEFPGINIMKNYEVTSLDTTNKIINNEISYDKLVIATGASPINLFNGFKLKTIHDGEAIKENIKGRVAIIGGGLIGLEVFDNLKSSFDVTLFEKNDQVLNGTFDYKITDMIHDERIKTSTEFSGDFDTVIECIGVRPNTQFIDCDKLGNGAIKTNIDFETSIGDVYAIGDCATVNHIVTNTQTYVPLATIASKQGRMLAEVLSGNKNLYKGTNGSVCLEFAEYELAAVGINEAMAKANNINYKTKFITDKNQTDYVSGQEDIHAFVIYDADTKVLLGAQLIGKKGAVLRTDVLALAIEKKMTTSELGYIDFCYAPPFARTWDFLNVIGNVCS